MSRSTSPPAIERRDCGSSSRRPHRPGLIGRGIGHSLLRAGHWLGIVANRKREIADELRVANAAVARIKANVVVGPPRHCHVARVALGRVSRDDIAKVFLVTRLEQARRAVCAKAPRVALHDFSSGA